MRRSGLDDPIDHVPPPVERHFFAAFILARESTPCSSPSDTL